MPRRRDPELMDTALHLFTRTPVWVGPAVAAFLFAILWCLPYILPDNSPVKLLTPICHLLAFIFAGMMLVAWLAACIIKLKNRLLFNHHRADPHHSIRQLHWHDFERLVAEAFRRQGYHVLHTGTTSHDGGIDLDLSRNGQRTLVQCKHWKAFKVGVAPLRELLGTLTSEKAHHAILVTSGTFTPEAQHFARKNPSLQLMSGTQLAQFIQQP